MSLEERGLKTILIGGGALFAVLLLVAMLAGQRALEKRSHAVAATPAETPPSTQPQVETLPPGETQPASTSYQGFLYARITTEDGNTHEGRVRFRRGKEAFWGDYFNAAKNESPWVAHVAVDRLPKQGHALRIFGLQIAMHERRADLGRRFMARYGDIARIDGHDRELKVTLKNGTAFELRAFEGNDLGDGLRVWDDKGEVLELDGPQIRTVEMLPNPSAGPAPYRLHGTVRTKQGEFTGFIQWDRDECEGGDELNGQTAEGVERAVRFEAICSIARHPSGRSSVVTLLGGREIVLSDTNDVGYGQRGTYVDDPRYGRVLVSWDAFERVDFSPAGSGPAYTEFPASVPLEGSVTTRAGARLTGRLVYDLDESETVETLDAPRDEVDYNIPFGMVASIVPSGGRVTLRNGEVLSLERAEDLGEHNAGILVFVEGREQPEYVPWADVDRIDFNGGPGTPPATASP